MAAVEVTAPCGPWPRAPFRPNNCITVVDGAQIVKDLDADASAAYLASVWAFVEGLAWRKTLGRFTGICRAWLRPCPDAGACATRCGCGSHYRPLDLHESLSGHPVVSVVALRVAGELVEPADIRVDAARWLVRENEAGDPERWWDQDLAQTVGGADTWEVLVEFGREPDAIVLRAVADMVIEQIKHYVTPDDSALGDNVSSVSERGRTYTFFEPSDTNSGVESWNEMIRVYGPKTEEPRGSEGLHLPPHINRVVEGTRHGAVPAS